jgi:hypothetical protein
MNIIMFSVCTVELFTKSHITNVDRRRCTDKKEKKIFLIYKEIQKGAVAQSHMRKGFLMYEEMRKYLVIYEEAISHI